jgi:hypothetical protein
MQTGDLIHRRTERSLYGNHYGVAVVWPDGRIDVIHRQKHNHGVMEPIEKFLKGYQLMRSRPTPLTGAPPEQVERKFRNWDAGEYDMLLNNCEHYAYRFSGYDPWLTDTDRRVLAILVFMAALALWKFK